MKGVLCFVALCGVVCGEFYAFGMATDVYNKPKNMSQEDYDENYKCLYNYHRSRNSYDTSGLAQELKEKIAGDAAAEDAMALFLDCKYWHLVDYCADYLGNMNAGNVQLFKEALVLLASRLEIKNYIQTVVDIIGDPNSITPDYFQNRKFLHDMFYYGAIEAGRCGYSWILIETCVSICEGLEILAELYKWPEDKEFRKKDDLRWMAYNGALTENHFHARTRNVWPNLPDSVIADD
jgi:hypothetical protein